jgi:hypothetical protein
MILVALALVLAALVTAPGVCHSRLHLLRGDAKPKLLIVVAAWMIPVVTTVGYVVCRNRANGVAARNSSLLLNQALEDSRRIAKSKGEDVSMDAGLPQGPVFTKEYGERYLKAEQLVPRPLDLSWMRRLIWPSWIICGLCIAGYYFSELRKVATPKSDRWLWPLVSSATLTAIQFFAILIPTGFLVMCLLGVP